MPVSAYSFSALSTPLLPLGEGRDEGARLLPIAQLPTALPPAAVRHLSRLAKDQTRALQPLLYRCALPHDYSRPLRILRSPAIAKTDITSFWFLTPLPSPLCRPS